MLGLLVKDLRVSLTRKYTVLVILIAALIMGIYMEGPFVLGYLTMIAIMLAVGTISYDEFDNGFVFLMTLPFDRKTYVREKYLFCFISASGAWCFAAVLYCTINLIRHNTAAITAELPMCLVLIPVIYIAAAIMIPLQLKFGAEKSRIVLYLIFGIIAGVVFTGKKMLDDANLTDQMKTALNSFSPAAAVLALAAVFLLAAFISYLISVRIMQKKEF